MNISFGGEPRGTAIVGHVHFDTATARAWLFTGQTWTLLGHSPLPMEYLRGADANTTAERNPAEVEAEAQAAEQALLHRLVDLRHRLASDHPTGLW